VYISSSDIILFQAKGRLEPGESFCEDSFHNKSKKYSALAASKQVVVGSIAAEDYKQLITKSWRTLAFFVQTAKCLINAYEKVSLVEQFTCFR